MAEQRQQVLLRRVLLEKGFTSRQIEAGEIDEGDATLLLQPVDAVIQWAASVHGGPDQKYFDAFVKNGVLKVKEEPHA